jgi:phage virion morphogenesis protein
MADDDLTRLDEWFGQILQGLAPAERRRAAMKLGQALRRSNLKRISSNTNPDGTAFEPRKARYDRKGRLRMKAGAKMFRGLRMAKQWKIDADQDGVEIAPVSPVARAWAASASSAKPSPWAACATASASARATPNAACSGCQTKTKIWPCSSRPK